jgi:hypothetical protein
LQLLRARIAEFAEEESYFSSGEKLMKVTLEREEFEVRGVVEHQGKRKYLV